MSKIPLIVVFLFYCLPAKAQWKVVGEPIKNYPTYQLSLAINSKNVPYVLFEDASTQYTIVKKFNGSGWDTVGNPGFSNVPFAIPSLVIDHNDTPYAAFTEPGNTVSVMKFNGTVWQYVGTAHFASSSASCLAIEWINIPFIAFRSVANSAKLSVMKYNGSGWVFVGTPGISANPIAHDGMGLVLNTLNEPYVAYRDGITNKATVVKFNGTNWVIVGTEGFSPGGTSSLSLAIDNNNVPYVAFADAANAEKPAVMKFDGANWINAGNSGLAVIGVNTIRIAIDPDNTPYIAYVGNMESTLRGTVMKLTNSTWNILGQPYFTPRGPTNFCLAIDTSGVPYVAGDSSSVTVMRNKAILGSYTFNGTGNWSNPANWLGGVVPPSTLLAGYEIIVNPIQGVGKNCFLDVPVTIANGAGLTIVPGSKFYIGNNLTFQ